MTGGLRGGRLTAVVLATAGLGLSAVVATAQEESPPYTLPPEHSEPGSGERAPRPRSVVLERVTGRVRYRRPDARRHRTLRGRARVPFGTSVSTTAGRVRVRATAQERTWRSEFFGGRFELVAGNDLDGAPLVTLRLVGGSYARTCGASDATARSSARRRKRVRRLWGSGKGRFRTRGRYSAATVRGTKWLVEDRCDGTLTRVARGAVEVEDFTEDPFPVGRPEEGAPDRAPAPAAGGDGQGSRVYVRRGGSYSARPRD